MKMIMKYAINRHILMSAAGIYVIRLANCEHRTSFLSRKFSVQFKLWQDHLRNIADSCGVL